MRQSESLVLVLSNRFVRVYLTLNIVVYLNNTRQISGLLRAVARALIGGVYSYIRVMPD